MADAPALRPLVILHGYGDQYKSLETWRTKLSSRGVDAASIRLGNYVSFDNEITIKDLAEGLDRALRIVGIGDESEFDAIVHSTGMLVVRDWLTAFDGRRARLKHLIGLAPATFGSPLASTGRGWLGGINALVHGKDNFGPDFAAAGDKILAALELGSADTWALAHRDLLLDDDDADAIERVETARQGAEIRGTGKVFYGPDGDTPYPFILDGLDGYGGIRGLANSPGSDGTVRWSGVGFNVRKVRIDFTRDPSLAAVGATARVRVDPWRNARTPLALISGYNHGTILGDPSDGLVDAVVKALAVESAEDYAAWEAAYAWNVGDATGAGVGAGAARYPTRFLDRDLKPVAASPAPPDEFQQFLVRVVDHRDDPVYDYYLQFFAPGDGGPGDPVILGKDVLDVHSYANDSSYRCLHLNLTRLRDRQLSGLWMRLIAPSGSDKFEYDGLGQAGAWDASVDLSAAFRGVSTGVVNARKGDVGPFSLFYPYTTTLLEARLMRVPVPPDRAEFSLLFTWGGGPA